MKESAIDVRLAAIEGSLRRLFELVETLVDERKRELPALMTQRQVLEYLKICRKALLQLTEDGLLHPIRQKNGARNSAVRYKSSEVIKLRGIDS
ncbi:MAG: hypothetical protein IKZ94_00015 [Lachnospiraceae bacterium]|nr:hypothetical protein [Lachnospiraceae bacterium]